MLDHLGEIDGREIIAVDESADIVGFLMKEGEHSSEEVKQFIIDLFEDGHIKRKCPECGHRVTKQTMQRWHDARLRDAVNDTLHRLERPAT